MRKKRKGSEADTGENAQEEVVPTRDFKVSNVRSHYSLEDYNRLKKRCKEDVGKEPVTSFKSRLAGIATAPPCGASSSLVLPGRGLKRKIGCIDVATQMGRKNRFEDDYILGDAIGRGKFGSVWLCKSKATGVEFACKTLQKGEETVHREVEIMQHLSGHPGVVTLHAVYEESECFQLVMELCSGGRLIDEMIDEGQCSEQRAANIFKDVMLVIKYCHDMGVVHRDIKPENILLVNSGKMKLADFGLAMRISNGQTLSGLAGSPAYVAPEVLLGNYSKKVDIWSAGVLLHALLVGGLPFQGDSLEAVFEAIKNVKLDFHTGIWESISKPARDLVARMLTRDVSARITADEVLRIVKPIFTKLLLNISNCAWASMDFVLHRAHLKDIVGAGWSEEDLNRRPSDSLSCRSEEQDECGLVDALAVAISHVKISEPKRSRLCGPTGPIEQQCSSNNLCRAF
ncbi:SERINE/THREONINE-PROTEIN KINASE PEPKR2 [Salix purpurea]|uniref:SERINE/THREONINE-PROTEIN KINASE PEPKR2 n=1 Tax=Salix purpurea TaxID=77065 RepID=A0A9Q0WTZ0_SALPP|nr:SERINE/THREONINE-PROTEIN KINASE PEPKR2 [Salix purpurea]